MRERERERERKRSTPLCNTAACGEDNELKVVALELAIVHSLRIVIVGVLHSRGFSRTGFSTLNPVSTLFSAFPVFCCNDSCVSSVVAER